MFIIRGACKNDSHFFLTLSFLVSDAIDTQEEGEEEDEDALRRKKKKMLSNFFI